MDMRRSFYFASGQDDLAESVPEASRLDYDDIPLVSPANDNFPPKRVHSRRKRGGSGSKLVFFGHGSPKKCKIGMRVISPFSCKIGQ